MGVNLSVNIGSLTLKNPIITASGTFGYGIEYSGKMDISEIGAMVTKGLSAKPRNGNPMPRICETPSGMINSIGLENIGIKNFEKEKLPLLRDTGATVIANFFGETRKEFVDTARRLDRMDGVHALEMNVSCPNIKKGLEFGQDPVELGKLTAAVKKIVNKPLIVKLSPNVADIKPCAIAVQEGGADAISAINTLRAMSVDSARRKPRLNKIFGGLSGPAIKPVALLMVYECAQTVNIPVIGTGGITSLEDVLEFMIAGAAAVQLGTMNFIEPDISARLVKELAGYCEEKGIGNVSDITGSLETQRTG
ncbi:MAG: dihydroorotate dehydrogenase B (NAD(+)), catalytic subunit [bacterium]|nr:MAG: dihydroorotate dehydrogenase B (NAD(+)), catalytic subunit [bacterium]